MSNSCAWCNFGLAAAYVMIVISAAASGWLAAKRHSARHSQLDPGMVRASLDAQSAGVTFFIDSVDRMMCASEAFESFFDLHPRDIVGQSLYSIWSDETVAPIIHHAANARTLKCRIQAVERLPGRAGVEMWSLDFTPVNDGVVCVAGVNLSRIRNESPTQDERAYSDAQVGRREYA